MPGVPLLPMPPEGLNGLPDWAKALIKALLADRQEVEDRLVALEEEND